MRLPPLPEKPPTDADLLQVAIALALWGIAVALAVLAAMPGARANDAGKGRIVLGFGAVPEMTFVSYAFFFRSLDHRYRDYVSYDQNGLFTADHRDFDDATEGGAVKILTLPAGDWARPTPAAGWTIADQVKFVSAN